jgi:hypothetical protein
VERVPGSLGLGVGTVRVRYKAPEGTISEELARPFAAIARRANLAEASPSFRFGAAVVEYAEILRQSKHTEGKRWGDILSLAEGSMREGDGTQAEFLTLVTKAKGLGL